MRKIFLILLLLFTINLFGQEFPFYNGQSYFIDEWNVTLIFDDKHTESQEIIFKQDYCIIIDGEEKQQSNWILVEDLLFFGTFGYLLYLESYSSFHIIPAFGHYNVIKIIFKRKNETI